MNWKFELEEYIKQGEPEKAEKSEAWQTAIGLQAVDGLRTSEYLLETAKAHIDVYKRQHQQRAYLPLPGSDSLVLHVRFLWNLPDGGDQPGIPRLLAENGSGGAQLERAGQPAPVAGGGDGPGQVQLRGL